MVKKNLFLFLFFSWFLAGNAVAESTINLVTQKSYPLFGQVDDVAGDEGLAGSFAGVHNNVLLVAGGTSFPDGKPWEGGQKYYSDVIAAFIRNGDELEVADSSARLPLPLGEGASVSVPQGVLVIGGQSPEGLSNRVFLLQYNGQAVDITELPSLPEAVKNPAVTAIGSDVYLIGGESAKVSSSQFLKFNVARVSEGWQYLSPFPLPVSGASAVSQMDGEEISIHVFGGRAKEEGKVTTAFYPHVYSYRLSQNEWVKKKDMDLSLSMASAVAVGASHIVLAGGDSGETYNEVEKAIHDMLNGNESAQQVRDSLWINHRGFNNRIKIYNTVTDAWFDAGEWEDNPVAVAPAVIWEGVFVIPGGEIRPGTRTPNLHEINFAVKPVFGLLNYLVLVIYFIGMLLLGFVFMRRESSTDDFFKAGGRIPWWAAGISIFATTLSAITFIAIPAKSYAADWRMFMFNMTIIMIAPVVIRYFLPFFRRFNFDTAYQYLEARFNRSVRWLASALFIFFMVSRIAIVLFLPSLALNAVTGFNIYWAILIMGIVTIIYCTSGGIEAVVWGDVIQGFILVGGALMALGFMISGVDGGLSGFIDIATAQNKFHTFDFRFNFSQPVFWVVLIGGLANTLISYTSDQSVVQRYMTTKDEKSTARSIWLNGFLSIPVTIVFFLLGTGLYAYYTSNPGQLSVLNPNIDSVFPQFIVAQMPAGVAGVLIAAVFAAAMSTLSSNINSVSAVITSDFYKILSTRNNQKNYMRVARWSGITVGIFGIVMAFVLATWNIASLWDQFNTFLGLLTGGLGALFVMGIFFPRISGKAALTGVIGGLVVLLIIKNYTALSFLLYGFAGLTSSILLALVSSLIMPNKKIVVGYTWKSRYHN